MLPEPDPKHLLDPSYASMARELAQAIRPVPDILRDYGLGGTSDPIWLSLAESADFKRLLDEAQREWNAADTTKRRIQLKAQTSIEMALPDIHKIIIDPLADRADRINAAKLMKSLGGMDAPPNGGGAMGGEGGSGVSIKIVIGQQTLTKDVSRPTATVIEHEPLRESVGEDA